MRWIPGKFIVRQYLGRPGHIHGHIFTRKVHMTAPARHHSFQIGRKGLLHGKSVRGVLHEEGTIRKMSINRTVSPDIATPNPHGSDGKCPGQGNVRLRIRITARSG
jgi:hypothetical protein